MKPDLQQTDTLQHRILPLALAVLTTAGMLGLPQMVMAKDGIIDDGGTCNYSERRILSNTAIGSLVGGGVGALVSDSKSKGAVKGALIGAAGGAGYGYVKERNRTGDNGCRGTRSSLF